MHFIPHRTLSSACVVPSCGWSRRMCLPCSVFSLRPVPRRRARLPPLSAPSRSSLLARTGAVLVGFVSVCVHVCGIGARAFSDASVRVRKRALLMCGGRFVRRALPATRLLCCADGLRCRCTVRFRIIQSGFLRIADLEPVQPAVRNQVTPMRETRPARRSATIVVPGPIANSVSSL